MFWIWTILIEEGWIDIINIVILLIKTMDIIFDD